MKAKTKRERARDLVGKRARVTRDIELRGGSVVPAGTEAIIGGTWRGRFTLYRVEQIGSATFTSVLVRHTSRSSFMLIAMFAALLAACGDNLGPDVELLPYPDAAIDAPADACVREPTIDGCCEHLPDEDAARSCAAATVPPGACGVLVCWKSNCTNERINFCAPDGGA